jgi:hypothetical protein
MVKGFAAALAGLALLGASWAGAAEAVPARGTVFQHFITRQGDKLMEGGQEFRFLGANMPGMIMPYDWTLYLPERLTLPTPWEQEDAFKTLTQMGLRVVRWWNLPMRGPKEGPMMNWKYVQAPGKFNDQSFVTIDHALALANRYGVRVIFDLTADAGDYLGGISTYAAWRGKKRDAFYTDPQLREDFQATLRYVLNRKNSVTGVRYSDDKAILAWQFGNELDGAKIPEAWHAEMAAFMKRLDPNHLIMYGHRYIPKAVDPNIDIVDPHHLYGGDWAKTCRADRAASRGKWPMILGEFGPYIAKASDAEPVMRNYRVLLDTVRSEGVSGALIWSMYFHHERGGFYWHQIMTYPSVWSFHWPGFASGDFHHEREILSLLREAAYRIQGVAAPPLTAPEPPVMLPVAGGSPLLAWRGSAGAAGYEVQRAPGPEGPWATLAANVSDSETAYRTLYSDAAVKAGDVWYYRAVARNEAGRSAPSNVIGPVKVRQACLVDELKDWSLIKGKSAGLKYNNDYNALYAEYLFRAKGEAGDWLAYQVPGAIASVKVTAFFAKEIADPTLLVSADGVEFRPLKPVRKERRFPSPPGGAAGRQRRTMVEYECAAPAGYGNFKILWNGSAEVDRIEIRHSGR